MSEDESVRRIASSMKYCECLDEELIQKMIKDLCRLALFMEQKRTPTTKEDVNKYVLKEHLKAFPFVFNQAQKKLAILGMELVQLTTKRHVLANAYILRSTLTPSQRSQTLGDIDSLNLLLIVLSLILGHDRSIPSGTIV
jgi:hypothetical protein